ncbi:MAG: Uma2 family endonuclease [Caldilineaceae bacterium]
MTVQAEAEAEIEEYADIGSFNHGYIQVRLGGLFDRMKKFTAVGELSLDVIGVDLSQFDLRSKEEIKPDLSLYSKRGLSHPKDILRMKEMPLLAVEIVSPKQGMYEIAKKVRLYFELGIQSCWVVEPVIQVITVYASIGQWETFTRGDVVDEKLGIRLPIDEVFA